MGKGGTGGGLGQWSEFHVCEAGVRGRGPDNQGWTYHGRGGKGWYTSYEVLGLGLVPDPGRGPRNGKRVVGAEAELRVEVVAEEGEVEAGAGGRGRELFLLEESHHKCSGLSFCRLTL